MTDYWEEVHDNFRNNLSRATHILTNSDLDGLWHATFDDGEDLSDNLLSSL